jgi:hypothetical protein
VKKGGGGVPGVKNVIGSKHTASKNSLNRYRIVLWKKSSVSAIKKNAGKNFYANLIPRGGGEGKKPEGGEGGGRGDGGGFPELGHFFLETLR